MSFDIHRIPENILLHILTFLPRRELANVSLVSQTWRRLCYDGSLWNSLQFESACEEEIKKIICKRSSALLTRLNLTNCNLTPEFVVTISAICSHLRELTLQKCFFVRESRRFRLNVFKRLKTLDARLLKGNTTFIPRLLGCTPNLETLAVDETVGTSWSGRSLKNMKKLRLLDLTGCIEVTDKDIEIVAHNCPSLESLLLVKCFKVEGQSLPVLLRNCKALKTLSLSETSVTDESLCSCDWKKLFIKEIDLSSCYLLSSQGLREVFSNLTDLKYLNLENCGDGISVSPRMLSKVIAFRSLEVLNLDDGLSASEEREELICEIAQNCPNICCLVVGTSLNTAPCLERCLRSLVQLKRFGICSRSSLEDLPILNNGRAVIPPNGFGLEVLLNNLAQYCHNLEALQLSGYQDQECASITNAFVELMKNCNNLARICSFDGNSDVLIMAADAQMQAGRQDVRLIKPTMLFPSPRDITPPPSLCFDQVVYTKEATFSDDPWRGPFMYEVQRNARFY